MNPSNRSTAARLVVSLALVLGVSSLALGDTYKTEDLKEAAPKSVSKDIGKLLREKGTRVLDPKGKSFVDIWLRKEVDPTGDRVQAGEAASMPWTPTYPWLAALSKTTRSRATVTPAAGRSTSKAAPFNSMSAISTGIVPRRRR